MGMWEGVSRKGTKTEREAVKMGRVAEVIEIDKAEEGEGKER